jgi:hypothetical protein
LNAPLPLANKCQPSQIHPTTTKIRTVLRRVSALKASGIVIQFAWRVETVASTMIDARIAP